MALKFDKEGLLAAFKKHADDRGKADSLNLVEFGEMMIELVGHEAGYTAEDFTVRCHIFTLSDWYIPGVFGPILDDRLKEKIVKP